MLLDIGFFVLFFYWNEFSKFIPVEKPLVTNYISFVPKTYLYKAHLTTTRSLVTGGFEEKTPNIWGSFVQNLVCGHFQRPQRVLKPDKHSIETLSRMFRYHAVFILQSCFFDQTRCHYSANGCKVILLLWNLLCDPQAKWSFPFSIRKNSCYKASNN